VKGCFFEFFGCLVWNTVFQIKTEKNMSDQEGGAVTSRRGRPLRSASKSEDSVKPPAKPTSSRSKKKTDDNVADEPSVAKAPKKKPKTDIDPIAEEISEDEVPVAKTSKKKTVKEVEPLAEDISEDAVPIVKTSKKKPAKEVEPAAEEKGDDAAVAKASKKKTVKEVEPLAEDISEDAVPIVKVSKKKPPKDVVPVAGKSSEDEVPMAKASKKKNVKEAKPEGDKQNGGERKTRKRIAGDKETPSPPPAVAPVKKGRSKKPVIEIGSDSEGDVDEGVGEDDPLAISSGQEDEGAHAEDKSGDNGSRDPTPVDDENGGAKDDSDHVIPNKRNRGRPAKASAKPTATKRATGKMAKQ